MAEDASTQQRKPEPANGPRSLPVPTTFGGVAALALGPGRWLAAWQAAVALTAGIVVAWSLDASWVRAILHAADTLPDTARISNGELTWPDNKPKVLITGPFLGIVVDPLSHRDSSLAADITLSLEIDGFALRSFLGWKALRYPSNLDLSLGRLDFAGNLSAWTGPIQIATAIVVFVALIAVWAVLATIYGGILWAVSPRSSRNPGFRVAWRVAASALLLPALMMTAAIALYATRRLGLVGVCFAGPIHMVVGWIYCIGGWTRLPRSKPDPFGIARHAPQAEKRSALPKSPFQRP